jgi:hypothetical protein
MLSGGVSVGPPGLRQINYPFALSTRNVGGWFVSDAKKELEMLDTKFQSFAKGIRKLSNLEPHLPWRLPSPSNKRPA